MKSGWLTSGVKVEEFERLFLKEVGGKHAIAVNSCTAALHLALLTLDVKPEDSVVTSPITFASAVNVIEHMRARPTFIDVNPHDLTIRSDEILHFLSPWTKAIIATHFAGNPADMQQLDWITEKTGIPVITDAAHAIETMYQGRPSGRLGRVACYSFYATKNMTTGEGGMLVTNDDKIAERARTLRLHGMTRDAWQRYGPSGYKHWDITEPGFKYNMSDMQAALGIAQLKDLGEWHRKRQNLYEVYRVHLTKKAKMVEFWNEKNRSAFHLCVIRIPKRDEVMVKMQEKGIGVGVHFRAVHRLVYYRNKYKIPLGALPAAEQASDEVLSLPLYPSMETADVFRVLKTLEETLSEVGV
jgi:dTDP-4-amino-4,6-dideoxygalactose transaminase